MRMGMTRESPVHRKEMHETVIRFAPLLIIDQETLEWAIAGKHAQAFMQQSPS
jgi:hypothetical protein